MGGPFDEITSLPCKPEIERKVLASAVYAPDWYDGLGVRRDDFFLRPHRRIYDAIEALRLRGGRGDLNFVNVRLELDRARGKQPDFEALAEVIEEKGKPTELEVRYLRELSLCRLVASAMGSVASAVAAGDVRKVREALDAACAAAEQEDLGNTVTMHELAAQANDAVKNRDEEDQGADLGITHFRGHLGNLPRGNLMVIGARPNVGKSGLALAMSAGAIPYGTKPGYISLEDAPTIVGPRGLAMTSGVSPRSMQRGKITPEQLPSMARGVELWEGLPFFVDFPRTKDHQSVKQSMRRLARRGANLVLIDYLQVIRFAEKGIDRAEAVGYMLSEFKSVADECGQSIVLFSQLRRLSTDDKRMKRVKGKVSLRPTVEELKASGDIEEKADVVALMWRDEHFDNSVVHVEIAKGKWGGVGYEFDMVRGDDAVLREVKTYEQQQGEQKGFGF